MSKRNPNDPIPGFDEYTGTVGREKKFHKTHFTVPELPWKKEGQMNWYDAGSIAIDPRKNHVNMSISFELPPSLLPDDVLNDHIHRGRWLFAGTRRVAPCGDAHKEYAELLRSWAKQFNEWANVVEKMGQRE